MASAGFPASLPVNEIPESRFGLEADLGTTQECLLVDSVWSSKNVPSESELAAAAAQSRLDLPEFQKQPADMLRSTGSRVCVVI